jgi:methionine aminotransferase
MIEKTVVINSKLPDVGQSIFSVMTAMANQYGAINLAQGFPDFNPPALLMERLNHHMLEGRNQYAPMPGLPALKEKLADKLHTLYGVSCDPATEITITAGATQGIKLVIDTVVDEGDEVIIFEPAYDSYLPSVLLNKGIPRFVQLNAADFSVDWGQVKKLINLRTKLIIINNPHNPTGAILKEEDINELKKLLEGTNIMLLSDEVYEHITFDGKPHLSICKYPELLARAFVVFSFGKTYHNTGWKTGYVVAQPKLSEELRKVLSYSMFSVMTPVQYALADILDHEEYYLDLNSFYQKKRDVFLEGIKGTGLRPIPCEGTYFQCVDYSEITQMKDTEFAALLTKEYGLASIPTSPFYHDKKDNKILRFCFAKGEETLRNASERLQKIKEISVV